MQLRRQRCKRAVEGKASNANATAASGVHRFSLASALGDASTPLRWHILHTRFDRMRIGNMSKDHLVVQHGGGSVRTLLPHYNRGLEVSIVTRGTLEWQVEGERELVGPGSVFFTLPW